MKKILFAAAAIAAALFASCDKDNGTINPALPETSDGARIAITLTGADEADTRAFFDASAKAESWESSLSSLSVFAFDNGGALIIRRDFTSSELSSKSATFSLPKSAAGTECSFYAVANYDASSAKTRAALTALVEKSAADYNGTGRLRDVGHEVADRRRRELYDQCRHHAQTYRGQSGPSNDRR